MSEVRVAKLIEYTETAEPFAEFFGGLCRSLSYLFVLDCLMLAVGFHEFHEVAIELAAFVQVEFVLHDKKFEQLGDRIDRQIFVLLPNEAEKGGRAPDGLAWRAIHLSVHVEVVVHGEEQVKRIEITTCFKVGLESECKQVVVILNFSDLITDLPNHLRVNHFLRLDNLDEETLGSLLLDRLCLE